MADLMVILNFILAVWPIVEKVVKLIEELLKPSSGTEKRTAAITMVKAALPFVPGNVVLADDIIGKVVDQVVSVKNWTGEFQHSDPSKPNVSPLGVLYHPMMEGF